MDAKYNSRVAEKERKIELIEEFYREYGRLPKSHEKYRGVAIGIFLNSIKHGGTRITEEQMERLMVLGFEGQINDVVVTKGIRDMEVFYRKYGRMPGPDETLGRNKVGEMLLSIRSGRIRITEQQFLRLQKMGVNLTREQVTFFESLCTRVNNIEEKIKLIEEFYRKYGRLPKRGEKYNDVAIGVFLNNIKQGRTRITEEQLQRLLVLGFVLEVEDGLSTLF